MPRRWGAAVAIAALLAVSLSACGSSSDDTPAATTSTTEARPRKDKAGPATTAAPTTAAPATTAPPPPPTTAAPPPPPAPLPAAGNPDGNAPVPAEAQAADTSRPDRVVGDGSAASCTSQAVVDAVAAGGIVTFACGPDPVTITMEATAKVRNDTGPEVVLDGGGKVTLSGGGQRRILYMNTCDEAQAFTTSHCQDQDHPRLTVQNLTFADGNATGDTTEGGGGGAIFVRGGRVKVVNSRFVRNTCDATGPDVGGAALRVLSQSQGLPVYIVATTADRLVGVRAIQRAEARLPDVACRCRSDTQRTAAPPLPT